MKSNLNKTKVAMWIPIYFGEIYLQETINSILKQSFQNFEIIISDNNPGGLPESVAGKYAESDHRIRYIKHNVKMGALQNWNSLISYANGEYFIYAGAHDLWSENLLENLVRVLDSNPNVVNAYAPSFLFENDILNPIGCTGFVDTSNSGVLPRINQILWAGQDSLYGLIRLNCIKQTHSIFGPYINCIL